MHVRGAMPLPHVARLLQRTCICRSVLAEARGARAFLQHVGVLRASGVWLVAGVRIHCSAHVSHGSRTSKRPGAPALLPILRALMLRHGQHPDHSVLEGERLIRDVYQSVRASPQWNHSLLLITV